MLVKSAVTTKEITDDVVVTIRKELGSLSDEVLLLAIGAVDSCVPMNRSMHHRYVSLNN